MQERGKWLQLEHAVLRESFRHAKSKPTETFNRFAGAGQEIPRIDMLQTELAPEQQQIRISLEPFVFHGLHVDYLG